MRNEKGITLIALILAILVLLVLAGISVSLMLSNEDEKNTVTNSDIENSTFSDKDIYEEDIETDENENYVFTDSMPAGVIDENVTPVNEVTEAGNVVNNVVANSVR